MEIGMGFWLGVFAGLVVALIALVVVIVSRRAVKNNTAMIRHAERSVTAVMPAPPAQSASSAHFSPPETGISATRVLPQPARALPASARVHAAPVVSPVPASAPDRKEPSGNTMIVEAFESRDKQLSASIQEVRDMLLKLADLIASAESASGKAADAFNSAKDTIHSLESGQSPELREAQRFLLREIDRVLSTNAALHSELDLANKGIADQRRQIEELRVQARVDALTRVPNRAAFDERLAEYTALFERTALAFSLLLVDIDHFKRVNDDPGHISGDRILRGIASKISESVRTNDFVARYGGEEFAVIFPGTGLEEALSVSERIRADIAKTNFRMDQKTLKITISGGIAECCPAITPKHLVEAADKALYQAKNAGRNRIVPAGDDGVTPAAPSVPPR